MKLKPIKEQVVVVFGASSGIGRETALQFAGRGAKVVVAARDENGLQSLVGEIEQNGGSAAYLVSDAVEFESVKAVADFAVSRFGHLDTWVHAAATSLYATFEQTTPEEFRRVIEVNLVGAAHGAMAALPHLRATGGGALSVISSVEGKTAFPLQSAYASSKHGIIGFLDALRMELKREGAPISVTNVMPAGINTPFFNKARTKLGVKPMPAPPIYNPNVVANVILWAAEHPTREVFAGGAGKSLWFSQWLSPSIVDKFGARLGVQAQKTDEPRNPDAPDSLFHPIAGFDRTTGDFSDIAKTRSFSGWLETHPLQRKILKGAAFSLAALLITRAFDEES